MTKKRRWTYKDWISKESWDEVLRVPRARSVLLVIMQGLVFAVAYKVNESYALVHAFLPVPLLVICIGFVLIFLLIWFLPIKDELFHGKAEAFIVAVTSAALLAHSAVIFLNGFLDGSDPTDHTARVISTDIWGDSKGYRSEMKVVSWHPANQTGTETLFRTFPEFKPGSSLLITTKQGLLGMEWIVRVDLVSQP